MGPALPSEPSRPRGSPTGPEVGVNVAGCLDQEGVGDGIPCRARAGETDFVTVSGLNRLYRRQPEGPDSSSILRIARGKRAGSMRSLA